MNIHLDRVNKILAGAEKDGRSFLLEHEVYAVLKAAGLGAPRFFFLEKGKKARPRDLAGLGTDSSSSRSSRRSSSTSPTRAASGS